MSDFRLSVKNYQWWPIEFKSIPVSQSKLAFKLAFDPANLAQKTPNSFRKFKLAQKINFLHQIGRPISLRKLLSGGRREEKCDCKNHWKSIQLYFVTRYLQWKSWDNFTSFDLVFIGTPLICGVRSATACSLIDFIRLKAARRRLRSGSITQKQFSMAWSCHVAWRCHVARRCHVAVWIRPQPLTYEVPGSNSLAAAVCALGKALCPHCLVPLRGLKAFGPLVTCLQSTCFLTGQVNKSNKNFFSIVYL